MKLLAFVHLYPPDHCAGAEMMLHETLLYLQAQGHEVSVVCDKSSVPMFESVPVITADTIEAKAAIKEADLIVTHLDRTGRVIQNIRNTKPIVHLVHNGKQLNFHRVTPRFAQLVVFNSRWLRDSTSWNGRKMVLTPPVKPERYLTTRGEAVTLINLSVDKGASTFWHLAQAFPGVQFIGVVGGYAPQVIPDYVPANVTVVEHTSNIKEVYAQTKILLMPSNYESWGRVGTEAAASGIPTIATATPGLLESLSYSGTFVNKGDLDGWEQALVTMFEPDIYEVKSKLATARSAELEAEQSLQLQQLEAELLNITYDWSKK